MRLKMFYLGVLGLVPDLDAADVRLAIVEVVDLNAIEMIRKAPDGVGSRGRLPARGDRDRGGHKSISVLT